MICCKVFSIIFIRISKEVLLKKVVNKLLMLKVVVKVGIIVIKLRNIELGSVILVVIELMNFLVGLLGFILGMKVFWCFR